MAYTQQTRIPVQHEWDTYQGRGYVGELARASGPYLFENHRLSIPAGGHPPRPGDAVYWDSTKKMFALPTNAVQSAAVVGILSYEVGSVQKMSDSKASGSNSRAYVEFQDKETVTVGQMGTFYVLAGAALEFGDSVEWKWSAGTGQYAWVKRDVPAFAATPATATVDLSAVGATWNATVRDAVQAAVDTAVDAALAAEHALVKAYIDDLRRLPITCVEPKAATAGDIVEVRLGDGRVL